ncbi:hypothetical protein SGM_4495 [Streptomyces griseoaurantiacus M045]|uniref:Uncharacterized protein n=1 Tax=Streptomyces griseoaurantiacus M045 TaxID=996637 RepID=F3NMY1_9ACTN|nr:hypothetical protein SGM_4495 [Streptomyces griseoaurantiacus M045]
MGVRSRSAEGEEPEQSGQRAPVPRSALLCGEDGSTPAGARSSARPPEGGGAWTRPCLATVHCGWPHAGVSMRGGMFLPTFPACRSGPARGVRGPCPGGGSSARLV